MVAQNSNTSYSFYVKVTPDNNVGFFTVYHSTGDAFAFVGSDTGSTRPLNGAYPSTSQPLDPGMIGAATKNSPTITGTASLQNLAVSGTVSVPSDSLSIPNVVGLSGALSGKATLGGPANFSTLSASSSLSVSTGGTVSFPTNAVTQDSVSGLVTALAAKAPINNPTFTGTVTLPRFQVLQDPTLNGTIAGGNIFGTNISASASFFSSYGTTALAANTSSTFYTVGSNQRGLVFVDTDSTNASSAVGYFSNMSGVMYLSVLARNGNAFGFQNIGTAFTGTWNMNLFCNSAGALRVSIPTAGSVRWNIILLSIAA